MRKSERCRSAATRNTPAIFLFLIQENISALSSGKPSHGSLLPGLIFGDKGTGEAIILKVPFDSVSVFLSHSFWAWPNIEPPLSHDNNDHLTS